MATKTKDYQWYLKASRDLEGKVKGIKGDSFSASSGDFILEVQFTAPDGSSWNDGPDNDPSTNDRADWALSGLYVIECMFSKLWKGLVDFPRNGVVGCWAQRLCHADGWEMQLTLMGGDTSSSTQVVTTASEDLQYSKATKKSGSFQKVSVKEGQKITDTSAILFVTGS